MGNYISSLGIGMNTGRTDDPDPVTGLTTRDRYLIKSSWAQVVKTPTESGVAVLSSFLKQFPQYRQLFPFRDIPLDDLPSNKRYQAHCNAVIHGVSSIVDAIDDSELVVEILTKLGESHVPRKVTEQGFFDLQKSIIKLFTTIMKPAEVEAWKKGLTVIMKVVTDAMKKKLAA